MNLNLKNLRSVIVISQFFYSSYTSMYLALILYYQFSLEVYILSDIHFVDIFLINNYLHYCPVKVDK